MIEGVLIVANVVLVGAIAFVLYTTLARRRKAMEGRKSLLWLEGQLRRAIEQIQSSDEDQILAGCQTLAMLNDTKARIRALGRIAELTQHRNLQIANQARVTYRRIMESLGSYSDTAASRLDEKATYPTGYRVSAKG